MNILYLAHSDRPIGQFEAFESQSLCFQTVEYKINDVSDRITPDCGRAIITLRKEQVGARASNLPAYRDRRHKCRTVLKALSRLALSSLSRRVPNKKKNSLWSSPSRFPSSLSTQESTSNSLVKNRERAQRPAPNLAHPSRPGGALC